MYEWISNMKVVGTDKRQIHVFVTVNTTKGFGELITNQLSILKEKQLRLSIKTIILEYMVKIETIVGSNLELANVR